MGQSVQDEEITQDDSNLLSKKPIVNRTNLQPHEEHRLTVGILDNRFESSVELSPHLVQIDPLIDIITPWLNLTRPRRNLILS